MAKTKEELSVIETELKTKYHPLFTVEIPVGDDESQTRTIFLKKFDRQTLTAVQKLVTTSSDTLRAVEVFLKATYVGGDELQEILNDFDMVRSCEAVIVELIAVKKASLKKS